MNPQPGYKSEANIAIFFKFPRKWTKTRDYKEYEYSSSTVVRVRIGYTH